MRGTMVIMGAIMALIFAISSVHADPPGSQYVTGMDANHTVRVSPTSGPPSEHNALEGYSHFSGPGNYTPSWLIDKDGNLFVRSCQGCVSASQCVPPTGCVSGYDPTSGLPNCVACGGGAPVSPPIADADGNLADNAGNLGG